MSEVAATTRAGSVWRARVLIAIPILFLLLAIVGLFASARTEPPPPDPVFGPYQQKLPVIELALAAVLFVAAAALWRVYRRMVDTPVLEVVGARPGPARYHGVVSIHGRVAWLTDATGSIRLNPEVFTSPIDNWTARGVADPVPGSGQEITIYGDVVMDGNGDLWLGRWSGRKLPVEWLTQGERLFLGDGRSSVRFVAVVTGFIALSAWLLWVGVWLLQTWELKKDGLTASAFVLPRNPARMAVVSVGVGLAFLTVAGLIGMFNRLQLLRNRVESSAAMVDTFIQRRHDSIHSILAVVGASMDHQTEVLTGVALLRADAAGRQQ